MSTRPLVTVGGLVIAPDGEILLVRSKKWNYLFSLPGGKVEWGEPREKAFAREIREETSLEVTNIRFAMVQDCIFSTEFWKESHFVMNDFIADLADTCSKEDVKLNDEAEDFIWVPPEKALSMTLHHECRNLVQWYLNLRQSSTSFSYGILGIHQHQIDSIIGIYPNERQKKQKLLIDAKIKIDFSNCLRSENIENTVDYVMLAQICTELANQTHYLLLEAFASDILNEYMKRFNAIWAWVKIQKPSAIPSAAYAYVEMEKTK